MADKIRVGIVGSGGIFRGLHLPHYEMTGRAQITAVSDIKEDSAREIAGKFGAKAFTDYNALLEGGEVDAVDVCTHPRPHRDITLAAAKAGIHVLVEKPMCRNVAEADEMIAACSEAGVRLNVAYMQPFNPVNQKLRSLIDDGPLGAPVMAYVNQVAWFDPSRHPWLFIKEESGGMLVEQAVHVFDLWRFLYGPAKSVYAHVTHVPLGGTYPEADKASENCASIIVKFRSGASATLLKSWAAEVKNAGDGVVCVNGSATMARGGLTWKLHGEAEQSFTADIPDDDTYRSVSEEVRKNRYWGYASKGASIEHWLKCIVGEEDPTTGGDTGRSAVEIAEAAVRSTQTGEVVKLPL